MPLSRQTSRIVWPSNPSTTRPSTSIRMRGVDWGRCGAWVSSRRSASDSSARRRLHRASVGRRSGSGQGVGHRAASVATGGGRLAGSKSDPKYRIPLVSGRVASRSWSHSADSTMSCARSARQLRVDRPQETRPRDGRRSRPAASSRCGTGSTCRTPRSRRTASGRRPARAGRSGRRRRQRSPSRHGRRPRGASRSRTACRARRAGAGRPTARR